MKITLPDDEQAIKAVCLAYAALSTYGRALCHIAIDDVDNATEGDRIAAAAAPGRSA